MVPHDERLMNFHRTLAKVTADAEPCLRFHRHHVWMSVQAAGMISRRCFNRANASAACRGAGRSVGERKLSITPSRSSHILFVQSELQRGGDCSDDQSGNSHAVPIELASIVTALPPPVSGITSPTGWWTTHPSSRETRHMQITIRWERGGRGLLLRTLTSAAWRTDQREPTNSLHRHFSRR
jgi:hypothetical protein